MLVYLDLIYLIDTNQLMYSTTVMKPRHKKRKCANCGRYVLGHQGPTGVYKCRNTPMAFQHEDSPEDPNGEYDDQQESPPPPTPPPPPISLRQAPPASQPAPTTDRLSSRDAPGASRPPSHHSRAHLSPDRYHLLDEYLAPEHQDHLPRSEAWQGSAVPFRQHLPDGSLPPLHAGSAQPTVSRHYHDSRTDYHPGYRHPSPPRSPWDHRRERSAPPATHHPDERLARPRAPSAYPGEYVYEPRRAAHPTRLQDVAYRPSHHQNADYYEHNVPQGAGRPNVNYYGLQDQAPLFSLAPATDPAVMSHWPPQGPPARPAAQSDRGELFPPSGIEHVKKHVRNAALNGEFANLLDFLDTQSDSNDNTIKTLVEDNGRLSLKNQKSTKMVPTSYKWLEAWAYYELLMCSYHGIALFQDMVAYRLFILGLFHNYRLPCVLMYDYKHRQILGAKRSLDFNSLNHKLYVLTFDTGSVRAVNRCKKCNSADHDEQSCPFRSAGQAGDLPKARGNDRRGDRGDKSAGKSDRQRDRPAKSGGEAEVCLQYQKARCRNGDRCSRKHACLVCGGPEGYDACKKCQK